jgi:hypothetical protein
VSSLTDDLSSATTATGSGEPCKLCVTIKGLEPEDAAAVRTALENDIAIERLWKLLKKNGKQTPMRHIRDHKQEGHK